MRVCAIFKLLLCITIILRWSPKNGGFPCGFPLNPPTDRPGMTLCFYRRNHPSESMFGPLRLPSTGTGTSAGLFDPTHQHAGPPPPFCTETSRLRFGIYEKPIPSPLGRMWGAHWRFGLVVALEALVRDGPNHQREAEPWYGQPELTESRQIHGWLLLGKDSNMLKILFDQIKTTSQRLT